MEWYYEMNGQPVGPVTDAALQEALVRGDITSATRLWCQQWPEWRTAGMAFKSPGPALSLSKSGAPAGGMPWNGGFCSECHRYKTDMVTLGNVTFCEGCKPMVMTKLREGVSVGGGPWRDRNLVVTERNSSLPDACYKCGAPPAIKLAKVLYWHHPGFYFLILANLIIYLIVALCVRKTTKVDVPLCHGCNGRRKRNNMITLSVLVTCIASFWYGFSRVGKPGDLSVVFISAGFALLITTLVLAVVFQIITPNKIDQTHAWLKKAGQPFLDRLPQWGGR